MTTPTPCSAHGTMPQTTFTLTVQRGVQEAARFFNVLSTTEDKYGSVTDIQPVEGHDHTSGPCYRLVTSCDQRESEDRPWGTPAEEEDPILTSDPEAEVIS